jgi:hypothetical protein
MHRHANPWCLALLVGTLLGSSALLLPQYRKADGGCPASTRGYATHGTSGVATTSRGQARPRVDPFVSAHSKDKFKTKYQFYRNDVRALARALGLPSAHRDGTIKWEKW